MYQAGINWHEPVQPANDTAADNMATVYIPQLSSKYPVSTPNHASTPVPCRTSTHTHIDIGEALTGASGRDDATLGMGITLRAWKDERDFLGWGQGPGARGQGGPGTGNRERGTETGTGDRGRVGA
jgi:hypothetical protein